MTDQWERDSWDYCSGRYIRTMTPEERKASLERDKENKWRKCVSCGNASRGTLCGFCLEEE